MNIIKRYAKVTNAIDVLRTSISTLAHRNKNDVIDYASSLEEGIKIIAKLPTMVASYYRYKRGLKPIAPDEKMGHAENFLYMLRGDRPTTLEARVMDIDLILSAEHGLNASTFVARIAASTLSDIYSAIIAAISTLAGPLHGGARERVMEMIERIRYPENAELYIIDLLEKKERIMGFGHRVYKTIDPRARIYKEYTRLLAEEKGDLTWYNIAEAIERIVLEELVVKRNKPIYPNVDFYPSVVYKYLGIPKALATAIFAIGRVSGWVAHYLEQISSNRLIRPRAKYIGPHDLKLNLEAVKKSI
jgi:citrate synthase